MTDRTFEPIVINKSRVDPLFIKGVRFYPKKEVVPWTDDYFLLAKDQRYENSLDTVKAYTRMNPVDYSIWIQAFDNEPFKRNFYECIDGNLPHKPYFDVELEVGKPKWIAYEGKFDSIEKAGDHLKLCLTEAICKTMLDYDIRQFDFKLFTSHKQGEKYSIHVVLDKVKVNNNHTARAFYELVLQKIPQDLRPFVDNSMYSGFQHFRIMGCCKMESDRFKVPEKMVTLTFNNGWTEAPINYGDWDKHQLPIIELRNSFVGYSDYDQKTIPIKLVEPLARHFKPITDVQLQQAYDLFLTKPMAKQYKEINSEGRLDRVEPGYCEVHKSKHDSNGAYLHVRNNNVVFHCLARGGGDIVIGSLAVPQESDDDNDDSDVDSDDGEELILGGVKQPFKQDVDEIKEAKQAHQQLQLVHQFVQSQPVRQLEIVSTSVKPQPQRKLEPVDKLLEKALSCYHDDVANYVIQQLNDTVKTVFVSKFTIWLWNEQTRLWHNGDDTHVVNLIMTKVRQVLINYDMQLSADLLKTTDEQTKEGLVAQKKRVIALYGKLGTMAFCSSVVTVMKPRIQDNSITERLDSADDLLPIMGGKVIDFRASVSAGSVVIRDRIKADLFTFECPVTYIPNAKSQRLTNFLNEITLNDEELCRFLQGVLGLCLTGHTHTQKLYVLYGAGANGKSTLIHLIAKILGDLFVEAHPELFCGASKGGDHASIAPYKAELRGKRLAVVSETSSRDKINEAQVKAFTGGDMMKGKALYKDPITFKPKFKMIVCTNDKPECSNKEALWRRLVLIPFRCRYLRENHPDYEENTLGIRKLNEKFEEEFMNDTEAMSALFNWLLDGAIQMYTTSMGNPRVVEEATNEWKNENDYYTKYFDDYIEQDLTGKNKWSVGGAELYEHFQSICERATCTRAEFFKEMKTRFGEPKKTNAGNKYLNIRIIREDSQYFTVGTQDGNLQPTFTGIRPI